MLLVEELEQSCFFPSADNQFVQARTIAIDAPLPKSVVVMLQIHIALMACGVARC